MMVAGDERTRGVSTWLEKQVRIVTLPFFLFLMDHNTSYVINEVRGENKVWHEGFQTKRFQMLKKSY